YNVSLSGTTSPNAYNITVITLNPTSASYNMSINNANTNTTTYHNVTALNEGTNYTYQVVCNDTSGFANNTELRVFSLDLAIPYIEYNTSTTVSGTYNQTWVFINITAFDNNTASVKLYWNGTSENFASNNSNTFWSNKTGLIEGNYSYYGWINDSAGNTNQTATRSVILDSNAPYIAYNTSTTPTGIQSQNWIFINITVIDLYKDKIKLYWNGTPENFTSNSSNSYWTNKTSLPDGNYTRHHRDLSQLTQPCLT
ncbi:MAG: hypothetical protein HZB65_03685, partial [Candidatus Aenigmarchaeota archaeon]|nr:hypothetical protein [Candidatus Aenigmarchaeota archaeon]